MKATTIIMLAGCVALAACDEPYTVDPNANAPPQVTIRSGSDVPDALQGTRDVLLRDSFGTTTNLSKSEGDIMNFEWDGKSTAFPSNFPFIRFNKLLDGSTIEKTEIDQLTGRELGQCEPQPGAIEVTEAAVAVTAIRTCYSPSDKLVGVQILDAAGTPRQYLKYDTAYSFKVTANIKDKKGAALEPYSADFKTSKFTLLTASDDGKLVHIYGAPGTGYANIKMDDVPNGVGVLRLVFSGPMGVGVDANKKPLASTAAVNQNLRNAKLLDDTDTEVTVTDPMSGMAVTALFTNGSATDPNTAATRDSRVVFVYSPYAITGTDAMSSALPAGNYKIVLPNTVTDNGTVLGTKTAPVTAALDTGTDTQIVIPFTVAAAGAR
jgi:hypothetical protein